MTNQLKTNAYKEGVRHTSTKQGVESVQAVIKIPSGTTFDIFPLTGLIYGPVLRHGSKITALRLNVSVPHPTLSFSVGLAQAYHASLAFDEPGATPVKEELWPGGPSVTSAPDNPAAFGLTTPLDEATFMIAPYDLATPQAVALFPTTTGTTTADVILEITVDYLPPINTPKETTFGILRAFGSSDQTGP